jgi:alpha-amylase/alpha-mannosidase (GH57 family)
VGELTKVYHLFHASWIDENGSRPGNDLGTWIGEVEENHAWDLLRQTRQVLDSIEATPRSHPKAFESLYAAEAATGSGGWETIRPPTPMPSSMTCFASI